MMRNLVRTEGVVLRSIPYMESSNILTLFTKELGKIKGIAKGRRRPKSRLRIPLEILTRSELIIYIKEDREIHTIKEATVIEQYDIFREDYTRYLFGCRIAHISDILIDLNTPLPAIYDLFVQSLELITSSPPFSLSAILLGYILKILSLLGHGPILTKCVKCGKELNLDYISIEEGGTVCSSCNTEVGDVMHPSQDFIKKLKILLYKPQNLLATLELKLDGVENFLSKYVEHHTGHSVK
jgi:DNA repair protein RecO (recombination protein O)